MDPDHVPVVAIAPMSQAEMVAVFIALRQKQPKEFLTALKVVVPELLKDA